MRNPFFRTREKYDVWHSLNQNIKVEPCHKPKKYVLTIHDVNFMEENSLDYSPNHIKYFKEKIKRVDVITFISEYAKKQTMQYFDISGIENTIIYNGNSISEIIRMIWKRKFVCSKVKWLSAPNKRKRYFTRISKPY